MAEILLSSESFIKSVTSISDNLSGKYILSSLREAQEQGLKSIIGESLLNKLKDLIKTQTLDAAPTYKALVDKCQYYLAYTTIVELTNKVSYKIGNFGVAKSSDDNMQLASQDEIAKMQYYYQSKADAYCIELQNFVLENRTSFPELTEHNRYKIEENLHSAASCGIFLGGARGKGGVYPKCRRNGR